MIRRTYALLLLTALSCGGKSVQLAGSDGSGSFGTAGADGTTGRAQVLVTAADGDDIVAIAVDADRLYWSTGFDSSIANRLRSCLKNDCSNTQTSYRGDSPPTPQMIFEFRVRAGKIYWLAPVTMNSSETPWNIWSCNVSGCTNPSLFVADSCQFELDDNELYYYPRQSWPGLLALPLSGASQVPRKLPTWVGQEPRWAPSICNGIPGVAADLGAAGSDSLVWISASNALIRIRKDGTSAPEVLTQLEGSAGDPVLHDNTAYWPVPLLAGKVSRCSLDGCGAGPDIEADRQQRPRTLLAHDDELFFQREKPSAGIGAWEIAICPVTDCSSQRSIGTLQLDPGNLGAASALSAAMAVDQAFVYAVAHDDNAPANRLRTRIVRFPK